MKSISLFDSPADDTTTLTAAMTNAPQRHALEAGDPEPIVKSSNGVVITSIGTEATANAIVVQPWDGKIIVAGRTYTSTSYGDFGLVRYNPNGTIDTTFGDAGVVITDLGKTSDAAYSVALQGDKIVVAGSTDTGMALARYLPNGTLDTTFGDDADNDPATTLRKGWTTTEIGFYPEARDVEIYDNGAILAAGKSTSGMTLVFYTADGALNKAVANTRDTVVLDDGNPEATYKTFGGGIVALKIGSGSWGYSLSIDEQGKRIVVAGDALLDGVDKPVVAGDALLNSLYKPAVAVFDLAGQYVKHFVVDPGSQIQYEQRGLVAYTINGESKLLLAGRCYDIREPGSDIALARYSIDGTADIGFGGGDGIVTTDPSDGDYGRAVLMKPNGEILVAGDTTAPRDRYLLVEYLNDGTLDDDFGSGGYARSPFSGTAHGNALALQSDGKILVAGDVALTGISATPRIALARYNADGTLDTHFNDTTPAVASDFNGDGKSDILMRRDADGLLWQFQMNGTTITGNGSVATGIGSGWRIVGTGDYNGDDKSDILAQRDSDGLLWMYLMNGASVVSNGSVATTLGRDWRVVGSGDYNGDGRSDILMRRDSDGLLWEFQMNGTAITANGSIAAGVGSDWHVVGSGDYNGDGNSDILARRNSDGKLWEFQMYGTTITANGSIATDLGQGWQIVGSGDYNGDGKSDILARRDDNGMLKMLQINGIAIASQSDLMTGLNSDWRVVGSGDYNGDGNSDILVRQNSDGQQRLFQMNGATIVNQDAVPTGLNAGWQTINDNYIADVPPAIVHAATSDFNGDGKSDILMRRDADGLLWQFQMNGTTITNGSGSVAIGIGNGWHTVGTGDYNGDGRSDILARRDADGLLWLFQMNGTSVVSSGAVATTLGSDWQVVGGGDYNGDGRSDILMRRDSDGLLWEFQMNGTTITNGSGSVATGLGAGWHVVGSGDYNGDGKSDILARRDSDGLLWEFQMNGTTITGNGSIATGLGPGWHVVGSGDYNGDGKSDILAQRDSDGLLWEFQMNGTNITGNGSIASGLGTGWHIDGNADYNGDGKSDILAQRDSDGLLWMFLMDGRTVSSNAAVPTNLPSGWHAIGGAFPLETVQDAQAQELASMVGVQTNLAGDGHLY